MSRISGRVSTDQELINSTPQRSSTGAVRTRQLALDSQKRTLNYMEFSRPRRSLDLVGGHRTERVGVLARANFAHCRGPTPTEFIRELFRTGSRRRQRTRSQVCYCLIGLCLQQCINHRSDKIRFHVISYIFRQKSFTAETRR